MTQKIKSMSELKKILQNRATQALKLTRDEMFKVFQKHIDEYYSEKVFRGGTSAIPAMYNRTYKLLNSLIKTDVVQTGYEIACKVQLDEDYLKLRAEHLNYKENNPLVPFAKLILGILSIIASIIWLLQLALYVFPIQFTGRSYAPFMNTMFIKLNRFFPMIASAMVSEWCMND